MSAIPTPNPTNGSTFEKEFAKLYEASNHLYNYWKLMTIESGQGFVDGKHIKILTDTAQEFTEGKIKRLMVIMPPRHSKSTIMSFFTPAWFISKNPEKSVMVLSYNDDFASEQGSKCRALFNERTHKRVFPGQSFKVDRKGEFSIGKSDGSMNFMSGGAGTAITGRGADLIIIDDPIKDSMDASSESRKKQLLQWYKEVVVTRLSPNGGICLCMTRWSFDDLAGSLLEENGEEWTVLHMPAIDDKGNALWPERYPLDALKAIKVDLGERSWNALYQGRPAPAEGAYFNYAWFDIYDRVPADYIEDSRIRFWDLSAMKGGDYCTGFLLVKYTNGHYIVHDVYNENTNPDGAMGAVDVHVRTDKCRIGFEQEGGSASLILIDGLEKKYEKYGVIKVKPKKGESKIVRIGPYALACNQGRVHLLRGAWNEPYLKQICEFPLGKHDDMVDSGGHAFNCLAGPKKRKNRCWYV
jgi:hypothetical protein